MSSTEPISTWKTVCIGSRAISIDLPGALTAANVVLTEKAKRGVQSVLVIRNSPQEIKLSKLFLPNHFSSGVTLQTIYAGLPVLGVALCPAEAALRLAMVADSMRAGDILSVAMEPLELGGEGTHIFSLEQTNLQVRHLRCIPVNLALPWNPHKYTSRNNLLVRMP